MGKGKASRDKRNLSHNGQVLEGEDVAKHLSEKLAALAMADPNVGGMSIEQYLGDLAQGVRKVPDNMRERLSILITIKEVEDVVNGLKDVSVPGPSGITNKLLKAMLPSIKTILVHAGNKLLFGDETEIPEWIFHRTVVFILKPGVLKHVQDPHQFGFTEGRSCCEPTRSIIDVMAYDKQTGLPCFILLLVLTSIRHLIVLILSIWRSVCGFMVFLMSM